MARTAVVAVSKKGVALARQLGGGNLADADIFLERRLVEPGDQVQAFDLPLRPLIGKLFQEYQALVLFLPVGAVVRLIAPILQDKHQDPAVVCVDDAGRFAVSLVSGHVGGADRLAEQVAEILNATPVITSASHVTGTLAVDLLGQEFGWTIEADPVSVTRASAAVVNGEPVGVFQEAGETSWWPDDLLPDNITRYPSLASLAQSPSVAALVISDRVPPQADGGNFPQVLSGKIVILYRPASLVVGLGCRRGVPAEELEQLLLETFEQHRLSIKSISCVATAELKQDEPGILTLAEKYRVPLLCYGSAELNGVFETDHQRAAEPGAGLTPSEKAHSLLGIWGVSEPAALLASGSHELLVPKRKAARATVAVARKEC